MKELFEGNEALFVGLDVHDGWDWSVRHPVLRLDFSSGHFAEPGYLPSEVITQLQVIEQAAGIRSDLASGPARFRNLITALRERAGQRVVVLVDEYDKPILDALEKPEVARANRDYLRGLYSTIKFADAHVKFTLLTGVSKFSKVSLFSGLNNLVDITLEPEYSTICGYTDADLDTVFAPELPGLDRDRIREWYNGYAWLGEEKVYNPFDVLLLFRRRRFGAWWFETGTPTFLVDTLLARGVGSTELDGMRAGDELLSAFDVDDIAPEALLFQTGYLTILDAEDVDGELLYRLGYPNREVRQSLNRSLLSALVPAAARRLAQGDRLRRLLQANDFTGVEELLRAFFASIPYEWHTNNDIARYEGYYASVFYSHFAALGLDVTVEDSDSRGRVDMAVRLDGGVYLFEFKVVEQAATGAAMAQLKGKGLRRQAPRPGPAHPPSSGGVQPGDPRFGVVRGRTRLTRAILLHSSDSSRVKGIRGRFRAPTCLPHQPAMPSMLRPMERPEDYAARPTDRMPSTMPVDSARRRTRPSAQLTALAAARAGTATGARRAGHGRDTGLAQAHTVEFRSATLSTSNDEYRPTASA